MKAADVMTRQVITVTPAASILRAARLMLQHRISGLPVVDKQGRLIVIVTEGDLAAHSAKGSAGSLRDVNQCCGQCGIVCARSMPAVCPRLFSRSDHAFTSGLRSVALDWSTSR
jgi:CBS-domain-containing membrane protein